MKATTVEIWSALSIISRERSTLLVGSGSVLQNTKVRIGTCMKRGRAYRKQHIYSSSKADST